MDRATEALAGLDWVRLECLAEELQELAATGALLMPVRELQRKQRVFSAVARSTRTNLEVLARVSGLVPRSEEEQRWGR